MYYLDQIVMGKLRNPMIRIFGRSVDGKTSHGQYKGSLHNIQRLLNPWWGTTFMFSDWQAVDLRQPLVFALLWLAAFNSTSRDAPKQSLLWSKLCLLRIVVIIITTNIAVRIRRSTITGVTSQIFGFILIHVSAVNESRVYALWRPKLSNFLNI